MGTHAHATAEKDGHTRVHHSNRHRQTTIQKLTDLYDLGLADSSLLSVKKLSSLAAKNAKALAKTQAVLTSSKHSTAQTPHYSQNVSPTTVGHHDALTACREAMQLWQVWDRHNIQARHLRASSTMQQQNNTVVEPAQHAPQVAADTGTPLARLLLADESVFSAQPGSLDDADSNSSAALKSPGRLSRRLVSFNSAVRGLEALQECAQQSSIAPAHDSADTADSRLLRPRSSLTDRQLRLMLKLDPRRVLNTADVVLQASVDAPMTSPMLSPSRSKLTSFGSHSSPRLQTSSQGSKPTTSLVAASQLQALVPVDMGTDPAFISSLHTSADAAAAAAVQPTTSVGSRVSTASRRSTPPLPVQLPPLQEEVTCHLLMDASEQQPSAPFMQGYSPANAVAAVPFLPVELQSAIPFFPADLQTGLQGTSLGDAIMAMDEHAVTQVGGRLVAQYTGAFPQLHTGRRHASARRVARCENCNTTGYTEELAASEVAMHKDTADRAHKVLANTHVVPSDWKGNSTFKQCMQEVLFRRPFFIPSAPESNPVLVSDPGVSRSLRAARRMVAAPLSEGGEQGSSITSSIAGKQTGPTWRPEMSVFAPRMTHSDSRAMNDTLAVRERQQRVDWTRVAGKDSFRQWLLLVDPGLRAGVTTLEQVLDAIRATLLPKCDLMRAMFTYYAARGHGGHRMPFVVTSEQWLQFLADIQVSSRLPKGGGISILQAACESVDVHRVGTEARAPTSGAQAQESNLLRFEFLEAVLRLAVQLYLPLHTQLPGVSEALNQLVGQDIKPNLPLPAKYEPSTFRDERLYTQPVDAVLRAWGSLLHALYSCACMRSGSRYMRLCEWLEMLQMGGVIGEHTHISVLDASLSFAWSQPVVVDDLQRRHRADCMDLLDCCEALARLADMMSPPPLETVHATLHAVAHHSGNSVDATLLNAAESRPYHTFYSLAETHKDIFCLPRRHSAGQVVARTRGLAPKLSALMDLLAAATAAAWSVTDTSELVEKLATATQQAAGQGPSAPLRA